MTIQDYLSVALMICALGFLSPARWGCFASRISTAGSMHSRADNVGLGLAVLALMLQAEHWQTIVKLAVIWLMVSVASANVCILIANESLRRKLQPWKNSDHRQTV